MPRPERTRRRLTLPLQHVRDQRVAVDCHVQRAPHRGRSERRTLGVEREQKLIPPRVQHHLDFVVADEIDPFRRNVGHHVDLTPEEVRKTFVSDVYRSYVVVEVAIYPAGELELELDAFQLRIPGAQKAARPATPRAVAAALQKTAASQSEVIVYPSVGVGYETGGRRGSGWWSVSGQVWWLRTIGRSARRPYRSQNVCRVRLGVRLQKASNRGAPVTTIFSGNIR